jgi:hypothetical protein
MHWYRKPPGFTGRPGDNARLVLAIAELGGSIWAEQARSAVDRLLREQQDPGWLKLLVGELWGVFIEKAHVNITSKQLLARLIADPTSAWCEYSSSRQVTERQIAILIRKLKIRPGLIGKKRVSGYHRQDFLDREVFEHFLGRDPHILSPSPSTKKKDGRARRKRVRG